MDDLKRDKKPCAVIGPDRVRTQPDISPRRTFQENMSRVVLPSPSTSAGVLDPYANYSPYTYSSYPYYASRPAPSPYYRPDVRYCEGPALVSQQHSYPRPTPQYDDRRYHPAYAPTPEAYYPKPTYYEAPQPQPYARCDYVHPCVDQYRSMPQTYDRQYYPFQYTRPSPPVRQVAQAPAPVPRSYPTKVAYNPYYVEPQPNPSPQQTNYPYVSCEYAEAARRQAEYHRSASVEHNLNQRRYPVYPTAPKAPAPCLYYPESVIRRPTVDYARPSAPPPEPKPKVDETPAMNLKRFVETWDDYEDFDKLKIETVIAPEPSVYHPIQPEQYQIRSKEPISIQNIQIMEAPRPKNHYYVDELIDVEAKISQSVIRKEVGCNFEIKPCSPTRAAEFNNAVLKSKSEISNRTKFYVNKNVMTHSEAIAQQERKISKRNRYDITSKVSTSTDLKRLYREKNPINESYDSLNVQLNVKFPNMTVSSEENMNYILSVENNHSNNTVNFEVVDKSGLQMPEYYNTQPENTVLNYAFNPEHKIDSNFLTDVCSKNSNDNFTFDLPTLKDPDVPVKLPDMEKIINDNDRDELDSVIDMTKENIDSKNTILETNLSSEFRATDSQFMDCLDVGIVNELPMLSDDNIERESVYCSSVFENDTKENGVLEKIDGNGSDSVIKMNESYIPEQKQLEMEDVASNSAEETAAIELSMQILSDENKEKENYALDAIPENLPDHFTKEESIYSSEDPEKNQSQNVCEIDYVLEKQSSPNHSERNGKDVYENEQQIYNEDVAEKIKIPLSIYNEEENVYEDVAEKTKSPPSVYNEENVYELEEISEKIQSPLIHNLSYEEEIVYEVEEDVPEKLQSPLDRNDISREETVDEIEKITPTEKSDNEDILEKSRSPIICKSTEDINSFLDMDIELAVAQCEEVSSKNELEIENTDSCSEISSPKLYKSDDAEEVPNFDDDDNFKSLSLKLISDDEYDTYPESVSKNYASYLTDDSSNDDTNYKNYKSVMLCGEKNLNTSTSEESMSPYYKDKMEQSINLDLNGLEVGGCWIDDIACVETVVSEDNDALEAQKSPLLWNNFTTNYEETFLEHNSGNESELFKDTNGNVIEQFKYKYNDDDQLLSPWESDDGDDKYPNIKSSVVSAESSLKKSDKEEDKPYWETPPKLKSYSRKRYKDDSHKSSKRKCIESTSESKQIEAPFKIKTKGAQKYIPPLDVNKQNIKCHLQLPKEKLLQLKKSKKNSAECSSSNDDRIRKNRMVIPKKPNKPLFEDVLKKIDESNRSIIKMKLKSKKRLIPKMIIKKDEKGSHYASVPKSTDSKSQNGERWQPEVRLRRSASIEDMVKSSYD